jgi:3-hydroxyisobutyrate dehydrogenase-like beta-hydroxyacid dehydrogenase
MDKVGFIGLGAMGGAMARNIHKQGYPLGVYNRSAARSKPFRDEGATVFDSPAALTAASDVVIIMVTDPAALAEVVTTEAGILAGLQQKTANSTLIINMSTVSPQATLSTTAQVRTAGGRFVDAPVSGTIKPAQDGSLVILAAGEDADITAAEPILKTMGKTIVRCGANGQATRMKLVLNLMLGGMMQCLAEGLSLADSQGLAGTAVLDALSSGPLGAGLYQMKGNMMLGDDFGKQFPVDLMFKDLNLVLETAGHARLALPMTAAVRESFSAARGLGYGDEDMAAVIKVLRNLRKPKP